VRAKQVAGPRAGLSPLVVASLFTSLCLGLPCGCDDATSEAPSDATVFIDAVDAVGADVEDAGVDGSMSVDAPSPLDVNDTLPAQDTQMLDGGSSAKGTFVSLGACDAAEEVQNSNNVVPGATCHRAEVTCEGLDPIEVTVLIGRPPEGVPVKGGVTFSSGTGGTTWYNAAIAKALVEEGFVTIRRRWSYDWETGPGGMRRSSCRFATMLEWLRSRDWTQGRPLCATGNSGGASEIAYGLSAQGMGEVLDLAVVTGGPPMGRVDLGCLGAAAWEQQCHDLVPEDACPDEGLSCGYTPGATSLIDSAYEGAPCAAAAEGGDVDELVLDSVVSPLGVYDYPQTRVHIIQGREDCSEAAPLGMLYAEAVTSEKEVEWVDAPHGVFQSQAGMEAIRDAILTGCVLRH